MGRCTHNVVPHFQTASAASAPIGFLRETRNCFRRGVEVVTHTYDCCLPATLRKQKRTQLGAPLCCANHSIGEEKSQHWAKCAPIVVLWFFDEVDEVEKQLITALRKDLCEAEHSAPFGTVGALQDALPWRRVLIVVH